MNDKTMRTIKFVAEITASLFSIALSAKGLMTNLKTTSSMEMANKEITTTEGTTE